MDKNMNSKNTLAKESIFTALMILMEKKDLSDISITEVTKKAGVSRMSFYRHYAILEDVITDYLDELFKDYSVKILKGSSAYDKESLCLFFAYFREHNGLVKNLIKSNLSNLILVRFIDFFHMLSKNVVCNEVHSPIHEKYFIEFAAGGLYKVLIEWVKTGLKENDMEMADICYTLMG
jgi:AcrR family transcriptional regulator